MAPANANAGSLELELRVRRADVTLIRGRKDVRIALENGVIAGPPGSPALPWRKLFVSLPCDARTGRA